MSGVQERHVYCVLFMWPLYALILPSDSAAGTFSCCCVLSLTSFKMPSLLTHARIFINYKCVGYTLKVSTHANSNYVNFYEAVHNYFNSSMLSSAMCFGISVCSSVLKRKIRISWYRPIRIKNIFIIHKCT